MDGPLDFFSSHDEITGPTHESDALRLRRALQRLRLNLQEADKEVVELLEEWQEEAEACEEKEQSGIHTYRMQRRVDARDETRNPTFCTGGCERISRLVRALHTQFQ